MKKKYIKIISLFLSIMLVSMYSGEYSYSWTTQVYMSPVGHEVLTKEGAYDNGDYYSGNGVTNFFSGLFSMDRQNVKYTIVEAGWLKKIKRAASIALPVVAAVVVAAVVITAVMAFPLASAVVVGCYGLMKVTGVWNRITPYYGTYNSRTISLIAGARYQDLAEYNPFGDAMTNYQKNVDNQKFHFLRRNDQAEYNINIMRDAIDSPDYGIKYKGIIIPIIIAHRAINAPKRNYYIGAYDRVWVIPDHFAMGQVLHTVQDGYAHTKRDPSTWIINDVMVYEPQPGTSHEVEHESLSKTAVDPLGSHDRIYSHDAGFFGINGSLKPAALEAKHVTAELLRLWKNRDAGWAGKDINWLITTVFEDNTTSWYAIVNRICAHR